MRQFAGLALFLFIVLQSTDGEKPDKKINDHSVKYPFTVTISGKGQQPIIFIPGLACSGHVWDGTKQIFEKHYKCYTLTMAGFDGASPRPDPSFINWEKAIAGYIRQNNIEQPIVIGHSLGGGLAMALAADYPKLISKIVIIDALPCLSALTYPSFQAGEKPNCTKMMTRITSATDGQFYQMQKMSISNLLSDTSKQKMVINWSVKSDRYTIAEMYCDYANTDLRNKISAIKCPDLILLEANFINFKPAIASQFADLKHANIHYASKGLHFIMYDDPDFYYKNLTDFIKP